MKVGITGHRPPRLNNHEWEIEKWVYEQLDKYKPEEFWTGMAQGSDQIGAKEAQKLGIPVVCVYPIKKNDFHVAEQDIMNNAKEVKFLFENYEENGKRTYWLRDKYLIDNIDFLIAIFDGKKKGGTWITIEYALKRGIPIIFYPEEKLAKIKHKGKR